MPRNRLAIARACYAAYASGDGSALDRHLADDLGFFSPADSGIDRTAYFERCWPNADTIAAFEFPRLFEIADDEVLVTYEAIRSDGTRFRNTEILTFTGDERSCA